MSLLSLVSLICLSPLMYPVLFLIFLRCAFKLSVSSSNTHLLNTHLCRRHLYSALKIKCWRKHTSPCSFRITSVMGERFCTIITGKAELWSKECSLRMRWPFQSEWGGMGLLGKMTGKLRPRGQISGRWGHREKVTEEEPFKQRRPCPADLGSWKTPEKSQVWHQCWNQFSPAHQLQEALSTLYSYIFIFKNLF